MILGPWTPILDYDDRSRAIAAARSILEGCAADAQGAEPALATGSGGVALALAWAAETLGLGSMRAMARQFASGFVEGAVRAADGAEPGLHVGLAGFGLAMVSIGSLHPDVEGPLRRIDQALEAWLDQDPWPGEPDLAHGLVGIGVYAAARCAAPRGQAILARTLRHLRAASIDLGAGATWLSTSADMTDVEASLCPWGHSSLGLARGLPGALMLLVRLHLLGETALPLLPWIERIVQWVRGQRCAMAAPRAMACAPGDDRWAGCTGGLGAGLALLSAARALGIDGWAHEALALARPSALRRVERDRIAGTAQAMNRIYQGTGETLFLDGARRRLAALLETPCTLGTGPGLLHGRAGIALTLLAAAMPSYPTWDAIPLLS